MCVFPLVYDLLKQENHYLIIYERNPELPKKDSRLSSGYIIYDMKLKGLMNKFENKKICPL